MPGNCKFNDNWLVKAAYKSWLKRSSNVDKAFCTVCGKDFSISAMGESAVSTHAKGRACLIGFPDARDNHVEVPGYRHLSR